MEMCQARRTSGLRLGVVLGTPGNMATSMPELLKGARLEQLALRDSVVADPSGLDSTERSELMRLGARVQYVQHRTIGGEGGVGNQKAVTAPRNRFRTHYHRRLQAGEAQEIVQRIAELAGLHVIGVSSEARISPLGVARLAPAAPPAAEGCHVGVPRSGVDQRSLEVWSREMRVPDGCWEGAHIDQMCRAFPCQQPEKLLERPGRMPDRVQPSGVHAPRNCLLRRAASLTAG
jgi:hypothetical protein